MTLNEHQYKALSGFRTLIEQTVRTSSSNDGSAWETMQSVWAQLGQPPVNGHCGTCALTLYRDIYNLILIYENGNGQGQ